MPLFSTPAVVLRKIDFRDADRIITFLTPEQGKLAGMARGVRRMRSRFGTALEVLTYGELIYFDRQGKNLVSINQFDILKSFQSLREDLVRSSSSQYLAELVLRFVPEREPSKEVFDLLVKSLDGMDRTRDTEAVLRLFEIQFLNLLGFAPRMDACVLCGKAEGDLSFSPAEGGLVCLLCRRTPGKEERVSPGALFFWKQGLAMNPLKMEQVRLESRLNRELKQLTHQYFLHLLGKEIRSYTFLEKMRREVKA